VKRARSLLNGRGPVDPIGCVDPVVRARAAAGQTAGMGPARHASDDQMDAARWCRHLVPDGSVYAFLIDHRHQLFPPELFADVARQGGGHPSVPAEVVATVMVLQALKGLSDREAISALRRDLAWKVACGLRLDDEGFHRRCWCTGATVFSRVLGDARGGGQGALLHLAITAIAVLHRAPKRGLRHSGLIALSACYSPLGGMRLHFVTRRRRPSPRCNSAPYATSRLRLRTIQPPLTGSEPSCVLLRFAYLTLPHYRATHGANCELTGEGSAATRRDFLEPAQPGGAAL
jgi:hypothetical protein